MVEDWKECWKWYSMHAATVLLVFNAAAQLLPAFQAWMPPTTFAAVNTVIGLGIIMGRLAAQGAPNA